MSPINAIRRGIERYRKGYNYEDLWSFDGWLSKTIARGLREFRQNCHGYPNDIDDFAEWLKILDEMVECFEEQSRDIDSNIEGDFMERWNRRQENHKQKLHRGLELLGRYYYDLWD